MWLITIITISITIHILTLKVLEYFEDNDKKNIKLNEYEIRLNTDPMKSRELLNSIVKEALAEWSIFNIRAEEESYISPDRQKECIAWVINRVVKNSTPAIIEIVSLGYPASTMEEYIESITRITTIHVLELAVKQNTIDFDTVINPNTNINLKKNN